MKQLETPFNSARDQHPLPFKLDGSFSWLRKFPLHKEHIGVLRQKKLQSQFKKIESVSLLSGIPLPPDFVSFITDIDLQAKIRSISDCYLDLAANFLPLRDGHLLRFLSDSQGCAFWYLFLRPLELNGQAVVICYTYFDADDDDSEDISKLHPRKFVFDSPSFESWLCRYWLENEIVYAYHDNTEPPDVGKKCIRLFTIDAYINEA